MPEEASLDECTVTVGGGLDPGAFFPGATGSSPAASRFGAVVAALLGIALAVGSVALAVAFLRGHGGALPLSAGDLSHATSAPSAEELCGRRGSIRGHPQVPPDETVESCMAEFDAYLLWKEFDGDRGALEEFQKTDEYKLLCVARYTECREQ
ncbi:MAG: hypothetical protein ABIO70_07820 [Pseudomonadota bacterium]